MFPAIDVLDSRFAGSSFTLPVAPGDMIVAHFDRLGSVELACS